MRDVSDSTADDVRLGSLTGSLGFLLRLAQLSIFRDFFEDLGPVGVRPGEITVLMLIGLNPGIRQGVLARNLMIKRAHMTKMVKAMEENGLIRRTVPEEDRRSVELWLTDEGKAKVKALEAPFLKHETRQARGLGAREEAELKRLLRAYLGIEANKEQP